MIHPLKLFRHALPAILTLSVAGAAHGQRFLHDGNISVGGTGQFSTILTKSPRTAEVYPGSGVYAYAQDQLTTSSAGFVTSLQLHPLPWAGVQLNYGFTHYQERYLYQATNGNNIYQHFNIPVDMHEATAGYLLHPKHIPFQPYVVVGGGAIDFNPDGGLTQFQHTFADNQWRATGLIEVGFDLPVHYKHVGFRVADRSLYYRAPNFNYNHLSTRAWRVTNEPEISTYWRF